MSGPQRGQPPVDRRRTQAQELPTDLRRNPFFEMRQPDRDDLLEPLAARLLAAEPDRAQRPQEFFGVIDRLAPGTPARGLRLRTVEQPQRRLAVITADRAKLVENFTLMFPTGPLVTLVNPA